MCSVNHDIKAIFIHIPKTGGTYIRENLEKYYGFKFYIIKRPDHNKFCNTDLYIKNQNFTEFVANREHGILKYAKTSNYINRMINMNDEKWNSYKKFCFVRNPYDRLISGWNFLNSKHNIDISFEDYIHKKDTVSDFEYIHTFMSQYNNMINENNVFSIDLLGKFENIEEDFKNILLNIGFKENDIRHDKNKKNNFSHKHYMELINTPEKLDIVNNICEEDFKNFDYRKIIDGNFYDTLILYPELSIFNENFDSIKSELYQNIKIMKDWLLKDENNKFYSKHTILPIFGYDKWSKYVNYFPVTVNLIKSKNIQTCCFLKLSKNSRLDKHYGYNPSSNYILRSHLGISIPNNCGMWVDGEIKFHKERNWITFDDSKLHTAFNNSNEERYILLIDMKRPDFIKIGNSLRIDNFDELINEFVNEFVN